MCAWSGLASHLLKSICGGALSYRFDLGKLQAGPTGRERTLRSGAAGAVTKRVFCVPLFSRYNPAERSERGAACSDAVWRGRRCSPGHWVAAEAFLFGRTYIGWRLQVRAPWQHPWRAKGGPLTLPLTAPIFTPLAP